MRAIDLVLKALSQVVPEKVCAGCSSFSGLLFSGFNEENNEYWAVFPMNPGSYGGRSGKDGMDSNCVLLANIRNMPVEELELRFPLRCLRYELRNDLPPAAGRWRGGINMILEYLFLQPCFLTNIGDRHYERPWGLFGGSDGVEASAVKNPGTKNQEKLFSKMQNLTLQGGDVIRDLGSMGGGYGSPYEREPKKVLEDVLDEYITLEMAEKDYGVLIDPHTMRINYEATKTKRAKCSNS
jgi:N-methylhydantoinase B/oxoprolinase/acetone carboxylase alpha subunit